jgi:hypothetical protein
VQPHRPRLLRAVSWPMASGSCRKSQQLPRSRLLRAVSRPMVSGSCCRLLQSCRCRLLRPVSWLMVSGSCCRLWQQAVAAGCGSRLWQQAVAAAQVQAAEGCQLADGVRQPPHPWEADAQAAEAAEARDALQCALHVPTILRVDAQPQLLQPAELDDGQQSLRGADPIGLQAGELRQLGQIQGRRAG